VIALVLVLAPFVDAFWARDLGSLQRELVENPSAEHRLLFDDLLRLTTCNKLEKIGEADPLRALVRVEEARRGAPQTLWVDVLRDDFFRKTVWNPGGRDLLTWPDEEERWPGEVVLVPPLHWSCAKAPAGSGVLTLLTPQLLGRRNPPRGPPTSGPCCSGARDRPKVRWPSTLRAWMLRFAPRRASYAWRRRSIRPRAGSVSRPNGLPWRR